MSMTVFNGMSVDHRAIARTIRRSAFLIAALLSIDAPVRADVVQDAKAPAEIVARAQAYLVSEVGAEYAAQNYELRADQTTSTGPGAEFAPASYTLAYRYKPWTDIGALESTIVLQVPTRADRPVTGTVATFDEAGRILVPSISRSDAEAKMRAAVPGKRLINGIHLGLRESGRTAHPVWSGSFDVGPNTPTSSVSRQVSVDSITGAVTVEEDSAAVYD